MRTSRFSSPSPRLWCCLGMMLIACSLTASAAINGALQTTTSDGTVVNYNTGLSCDAVYITGGPQNLNDLGLVPNGTYYVRVTDPAGKTDLSAIAPGTGDFTVTVDTVNGKGVITGGSHPVGSTNSQSGETTVQLWPFAQTPNNGGVYKAWISTDPNFQNSTTKTDNFKCTVPPDFCTTHPDDPACQNPPPPSADIVGEKYYDSNANGSLDPGELGIQGWQIRATPATLSGSCELTDENGMYEFAADPAVDQIYGISEDDAQQTKWVHTTLTSGTAHVTGEGTFNGPNFGNVCVGAGGGLTLGFWSNKNGMALETASDFTLLTSLNLVNGDGSARDFVDTSTKNKSALSSWLLNANATNMAYMLSAQLATMELNVQHGKVTGGSLVYLGPPPNLTSLSSCFSEAGEAGHEPNGANFISVSDLMYDANIELGLHPVTVSSTDYRTCEGYKKTALDNANNNLNFLQDDQSKCPAFTFANTCQ
jgi:hypothetical protein